MWYRVGTYWRTFLPCEHVANWVFITAGVHKDGGVPLCLVVKYRGRGCQVINLWSDWYDRQLTFDFWHKFDHVWLANGAFLYLKETDEDVYCVNAAIDESDAIPGLVVLRINRGTRNKEIVGEWLKGGKHPEFLAPEIDTPFAREWLGEQMIRVLR